MHGRVGNTPASRIKSYGAMRWPRILNGAVGRPSRWVGLVSAGQLPGEGDGKPVWKRRRSGQISDAGAPPAASPEQTFQHFSLIALLVQLQMEQSVAAVFRSRALLCITKKIELRLEQRDSTRFTTVSQSVWRSKTGALWPGHWALRCCQPRARWRVPSRTTDAATWGQRSPQREGGKRSANGCRAARERGGNRTSPSTSRPVAVTSSPCAAPWRWAPPGRLGWCAAGRRTSCTGAACAAGPAPRCTGSRVTSPLLRIGVVLRWRGARRLHSSERCWGEGSRLRAASRGRAGLEVRRGICEESLSEESLDQYEFDLK